MRVVSPGGQRGDVAGDTGCRNTRDASRRLYTQPPVGDSAAVSRMK